MIIDEIDLKEKKEMEEKFKGFEEFIPENEPQLEDLLKELEKIEEEY